MSELGDVDRYCGKKIEDMTREELIDALKVMGRLYSEALTSNRKTVEAFSAIKRARRAYG
jgi:hypothetical protein